MRRMPKGLLVVNRDASFAKRAGNKIVGADNARPSLPRLWRWLEAARSTLSLFPNSADGTEARKTSFRRSTICTAGKLASWLRRGSASISGSSAKLMRTIMAGLAEFERDLLRDRVKSGLAAARARGVKLGARWASVPRTGRPSGCSTCMPTGCPIGSAQRCV